MKNIGFIGLGAMGAAMARNLLQKGFSVTGYDIRPEAAEALAKDGGQAALSAAEAARDAEALLLVVVNAQQAENILFGDGALDALPKGAIVALMATCPPGQVAELGARVEAAGRRFIDCPISGGMAGAIAGTLSIMAAAPKATFDALLPAFEAMGKKIYHVGEGFGQGAMAKMINQLLCGVHIAVAAEALSLAAKAHLDQKTILEIVGGSAAASWMLNDRGPRMLESDPIVTAQVDIFVKDLSIVLDAGRESKAALPLAAAAHQMYLAASGMGHGKKDDSQVIRAYKALNPA